MEFKITTLEGEKTKLLEQLTELQTELTQLKIELKQQKKAVLNAEELAAYYQEMKPAAVVKIMDNLDDRGGCYNLTSFWRTNKLLKLSP